MDYHKDKGDFDKSINQNHRYLYGNPLKTTVNIVIYKEKAMPNSNP